MTLYRISLPFATFGLLSTNGTITRTAPIARWAQGKPLAAVLDYYRRRGAAVQRVGEP
jgi:hypothetical protein